MSTVTRNLNIAIIVRTEDAQAQFKAFARGVMQDVQILAGQMRNAFANIFGTSIGEISKLTKSLSDVQMQMKEIQRIASQNKGGGKGGESGTSIITKEIQQNEEITKRTSASIKAYYKDIEKSVNEYERALQRANKTMTQFGVFDWITGEKSGKRASESAGVFLSRMMDIEKEYKRMSSYKTTPYEYEPIKRIMPFVEKQLPYKYDLEKQLYAHLSTADKILKMTQDRLRNGLLLGAVEDVKVYMQQMLNLAQQVSPQLRKQVASIFREAGAMDIVKEYNKGLQEIGKLSEIIKIKPSTIESWRLAREDVKKLSDAFKNLNADISVFGVNEINRFYKDVISQTVVKGSGKRLGMQTREVDIENIQRLKKDIPEINNLLSAMGIEVDKTHSKLGGLWASARNYMRFQMGWFLGAGVIFSVVATIKQLTQSSMEFEQTLKNMQAVTGATDKELNILANSAKRIAMETPMAASEAAKLGLQLIRAGLNAKDAAAAMNVAAKVAVVSGEDAKVVADAVATAMMAWKIGASDAERVGNVIAAAMNYSRLTVQDLGTAFNYVAGVASSFNMTLEETTAVLAVYSNLGVRASTIATGWTTLMSEFISPSKKAIEYITSLTDKVTGLQLSISDINPLTHSFAEILKKLENAGFDASKALEVFEIRAGRALLFGMRAGSEEFEEMEKKIRESMQLREGIARVMEGPIAAFKKFWNQIQVSAIQIGSALIPVIKILTNVLHVLSTVIYHNIHLLTSTPGVFMAVAGGAVFLVVAIRKLIMVINMIKVKEFILWLSTIPSILFTVIKGVNTLRDAITMLQAAMPGGWFFKLAALVGSFVIGATIDKLLFGEGELSKLTDMKNQLDETEKSIKSASKQFIEMGDNAENSIDRISTDLDGLVKQISDYKIPEIKITADVQDVYDKFQALISQSKELANAIKLLEGKILDVRNQVPEELIGVKGTTTIGPQPIKKTPFDITTAMKFDLVKQQIPTLQERIKMTHYRDMDEALQRLKEESSRNAEEMSKTMKQIEEDALRQLNKIVKEAQKSTLTQQYNELASAIAKKYVMTYMTEGLEKAKSYLKEGAKRLIELNERIKKEAEAQASKDMVKDYQMSIDSINEEMALMQKHYQLKTERAKNLKEMSDESIRYEFENQKIMLDRLSMLNEEYYNMGIKSAKDYYDEKNRLLYESYLNEVNIAWNLYINQRKYNQEMLSDIKEQYEMTADKISEIMFAMSKEKKGSNAFEAFKKEGINLIKQAEDFKQKEEEITSEIGKQNIQLMKNLTIMFERFNVSKEQLELQRGIKEAQYPYQQQINMLNIEKEYLQVLADANEMVGNWNALQQNKIDLLRLEGQIKEREINKRIVAVGTGMGMATGDKLDELSKEYEWLLKLRSAWQLYTEEQIRRAEAMKNALGAIRLALNDLYNEYNNDGQHIVNATKNIVTAMENAFTDFLDYTSERFMDFGNLVKSILITIYKELLKVLIIKPLMAGIIGAIRDAVNLSVGSIVSPNSAMNTQVGIAHSGGYVMHSGGIVPRYHWGGLASDEVPAILQRGEYVVSRKGVAALDAINQGKISQPNVNVVVNVENQTGIPVDAMQKSAKFDGESYVVSVVLKNIESYGPLRHAIAGVK